MSKVHIVATTIWLPKFLESYLDNFQRFGRLDDVRFWVVGDRKSPPETADYVASIRRQGLRVEYMDPNAQESWLARFPDLASIIPWNSDNRRNVGFLRALEEGCQTLVSIDDDNYALPWSNFYEGHAHVGEPTRVEVIASESGWYNICNELVLQPQVEIVARGFPYDQRGKPFCSKGIGTVRTIANAGLWLGSPDVDAATRLALPVEATSARLRSIALEPGTWSPVNTQNTSLNRRAIPAYYYVRMLVDLPGAKLDRYGDIWSGYFLLRCAQHLGDVVTLGLPVVRHDRNTHDFLADLRAEIWGMMITPKLTQVLRSLPLTGQDYSEAALSLADGLAKSSGEIEESVRLPGVSDYIRQIASHLRVWVDVCAELM